MIVSIAGTLDEAHIAELEAHCPADGEVRILDLRELQSADDVALLWLYRFVVRGGQITGASPYIRLRLKRQK
jgi:hypothetical protein